MGGRWVRMMVAAALAVSLVPVAAGPARADEPAPFPACTPGSMPITGLKTAEKVVTFTFDDGPSNIYTRPIMDAFEARGFRATFFVLGNTTRKRAALASEMLARGHELANHTRTHNYGAAINVREMAEASAQIQTATGFQPVFYRMPGLSWSRRVVNATAANNLCPIDTNFIVGDWQAPRAPASVLCSRFRRGLKPGSLVVLHDGGKNHKPTVDAVPCMLDYAIAQGYQVLGLRDFLALVPAGKAELTFRNVKKR
jgi:peptidoglycan-N-acetylglucosamine deacetylase